VAANKSVSVKNFMRLWSSILISETESNEDSGEGFNRCVIKVGEAGKQQ
jgi:hypothetical protein